MRPPRQGPFFRKINWQSSKIYQHITRLGDKLMQWGNQLWFCHWGATAQPGTESDELDHWESDYCGRCRDLCFYLDRGHKSEWVTSAVLPPLESHTIPFEKHMQHTQSSHTDTHVHVHMHQQRGNQNKQKKNQKEKSKAQNNDSINWSRTNITKEWKMYIKYCVERYKTRYKRHRVPCERLKTNNVWHFCLKKLLTVSAWMGFMCSYWKQICI